MGSAPSTTSGTREPSAGGVEPRQKSEVFSLLNLPPPVTRDDCMLISVRPSASDELFSKKGDILLLEVGKEGFRILRADTQDSLAQFLWGQIHSWAHGANSFTFRYFDDGKHAILKHDMTLLHVDELLKHIQSIVEDILSDRRKSALDDGILETLLSKIKAADSSYHLDMIRQVIADGTLTSDHGKQILELLSEFDKVDAAVMLHGKLIDQNRFSYMLEALERQQDHDNVWHRITVAKKAKSYSMKRE